MLPTHCYSNSPVRPAHDLGPFLYSKIQFKSEKQASRSARAKQALSGNRHLTRMCARIGVGLGLMLAMPSGCRGDTQWSLVAPRSNTLPHGEPPASFERRENVVSPLGVSSGLDARPALLHTNKFYSNLLVRVRAEYEFVRVWFDLKIYIELWVLDVGRVCCLST